MPTRRSSTPPRGRSRLELRREFRFGSGSDALDPDRTTVCALEDALDGRMFLVGRDHDRISAELGERRAHRDAQSRTRVGHEKNPVEIVFAQTKQARDARPGTDHLSGIFLAARGAEEQTGEARLRLAAGAGNLRPGPIEPGIVEVGFDNSFRRHEEVDQQRFRISAGCESPTRWRFGRDGVWSARPGASRPSSWRAIAARRRAG